MKHRRAGGGAKEAPDGKMEGSRSQRQIRPSVPAEIRPEGCSRRLLTAETGEWARHVVMGDLEVVRLCK